MDIDETLVTKPSSGDLDFKELFQEAISARVGLPAVKTGDTGPEWTPSLLAEAIVEADPRGRGVDIRTVQNWFQDNDKGISSKNIFCLARVFGSGDPDAIAVWRTKLRAANKRLASKRRARRESDCSTCAKESATRANSSQYRNDETQKKRSNLATFSESVFTSTDGFGIAMVVWAGFFLLCLMSFVVENHDVSYLARPGVNKQVGFFWSLSWPIECLLLYPASFLLIAHFVAVWKRQCRTMAQSDDQRSAWDELIYSMRLPFWVAATVAFVLVFAVQWGGVYLLGLTHGDTPDLVDWISIARQRPEVVSSREALLVSLFAFFYSGLIYWFYFTGLLLLFAVSSDYYRKAISLQPDFEHRFLKNSGEMIQRTIFRCTIIGILVATAIQLNATYLKSDGETSIGWLADDFLAGLGSQAASWEFLDRSSVSSLTSSILLLLHIALFGVCTIKVRVAMRVSNTRNYGAGRQVEEVNIDRRSVICDPLLKQLCVLGLLCLNFSLLGQFVGFTIILSASLLTAVASICWFEKGSESRPNVQA